MKIVVSTSLIQKEKFKYVDDLLTELIGMERRATDVITPFDPDQVVRTLFEKREYYIERIMECDLMVVIPKFVGNDEVDGNATKFFGFGESVSWEISIARRFNKPILYLENVRDAFDEV